MGGIKLSIYKKIKEELEFLQKWNENIDEMLAFGFDIDCKIMTANLEHYDTYIKALPAIVGFPKKYHIAFSEELNYFIFDQDYGRNEDSYIIVDDDIKFKTDSIDKFIEFLKNVWGDNV